jgi:hypothetical protein
VADLTAEHDIGGVTAPPDYEAPQDDDSVYTPPADDADDRPLVEPPAEDDEEEALEPKAMQVERELFDGKGEKRKYTQRPLSYFLKIELYGLLARAVEMILADDSGVGISDIIGMGRNPKSMVDRLLASAEDVPGAEDNPLNKQQVDEAQAMQMFAAFARLLGQAPDMLREAYCLALSIPKGHRKWAIDWALDYSVDDDMGVDILHTFVDQNWGVMEDFFGREMPRVIKRIQKAHRQSSGRR